MEEAYVLVDDGRTASLLDASLFGLRHCAYRVSMEEGSGARRRTLGYVAIHRINNNSNLWCRHLYSSGGFDILAGAGTTVVQKQVRALQRVGAVDG